MSAALKFFLARLGLFLVVYLLLLLVPGLHNAFLRLMIALVVSFALSWFLLRRMREDLAEKVGETMERRKEEKEKLRKALSGEDGPDVR